MSKNANSLEGQITKIITDSKIISDNAVKITNTTNEISKTTLQVARASGEIANNSNLASQGVKDISKSSVDINLGIQGVIEDLNDVSGEIMASSQNAENTNKTAQYLDEIANRLRELTEKFKV
jgi:methyl-accepting chemotaxis protein